VFGTTFRLTGGEVHAIKLVFKDLGSVDKNIHYLRSTRLRPITEEPLTNVGSRAVSTSMHDIGSRYERQTNAPT
jgi:hypothetical protein